MSTRTTLSLVLLCSALSACSMPGFTARVGYMQLEPTGNFGLQDSGKINPVDNVRSDLESGFDISDAGTPFAHVYLDLGDWAVVGSGFVFGDEGQSLLGTDFGNISAGTNASTDLSVINVKAALLRNVLDLEFIDIGVGVCVDYFLTEMEVRSATAFEDIQIDDPAPMLFGRVSSNLGIVSAAVEVGWLDQSFFDAEGSYFDLDAMVAVNIFPAVELVAGYRNILIDADGDVDNQDFATHFKMSGFYIGGGVSF